MRYKIELSIDSSKLTEEQVEKLGEIIDRAIPEVEKVVPLKSVSVNSMLHWVQG